jgi:uncharacterized membrane protein/mono/diheme cytochrome c family protein
MGMATSVVKAGLSGLAGLRPGAAVGPAGVWLLRRLPLLLALSAAPGGAVVEVRAQGGHEAKVEAASRAMEAQGRALVPAVRSIFQRSCAECHDHEQGRPKGGFGFIMDLEQLRGDPYFLVPGEPSRSYVFEVMVETDPDFRMPPPEREDLALSEAEIRLVQHWILAGAPASGTDAAATGHEVKALEAASETDSASAATAAKPPALAVLTGKMHPLLVHFPIALLLVAGLAEAGRRLRGEHLRPVVTWCLLLGTVGAAIAAVSGWIHAPLAGYAESKVFLHRWTGVGVTVTAALLLAVHWLDGRGRAGRARYVFWVGLALLAVGIVVSGHSGGELVYGKGYLFDF